MKGPYGHLWLPGGFLLQWGQANYLGSDGANGTVITFPIAFPTACMRIVGSDVGNGANSFGFSAFSPSQFRAWGKNGNTYVNTGTQYMALGY